MENPLSLLHRSVWDRLSVPHHAHSVRSSHASSPTRGSPKISGLVGPMMRSITATPCLKAGSSKIVTGERVKAAGRGFRGVCPWLSAGDPLCPPHLARGWHGRPCFATVRDAVLTEVAVG